MIDGIPYDTIGGYGLFAALCFLVVRMVARGDLVPRRYYDDLQKRLEKLEQTNDALAAATEEATKQGKQLLEFAKAADQVFRTLPKGEKEPAP